MITVATWEVDRYRSPPNLEVLMDDYTRQSRTLRLMRKIKKDGASESGCWIWQAGRFKGEKEGQFKYGAFWWDTSNIQAHRAAWILLRGEIPEGANVLHKCHDMACCNPDHLYLGDHKQNMKDRDDAGRTSKWDHRYNFKRTDDLIARITAEFKSGKHAAQVRETLGIGWTTLYRAYNQSPELKALMTSVRRPRGGRAKKG